MITQLLLLLVLALPLTSTAEVTNVALLERSDVLDGILMHKAGPYERIIAKAHFAIDPEMPINRIITDIQHAPRNEHGQVEFSADLYVLKPRDPAKSNGTLLFEVVNRGRKGLNRQFNFGTTVQDPRNARDFGDALLLQQGFTIVWLGGQMDLAGDDVMKLQRVTARDGGLLPINLVRREWIPTQKTDTWQLVGPGSAPIEIPVDPDSSSAALTVRDSEVGPYQTIRRDQWKFSSDLQQIIVPGGFEPSRIYELVYEARDPAIAGLGLAAVRDIVSFFKYGSRETLLNDQRHFMKRAIGYGYSQSARFLRQFVYDGFNQDEKRRKVFDGLFAAAAGAGRGSFNHRFARPGVAGNSVRTHFWPVDIFPFSDVAQTDPASERIDGLLTRAERDGVVPKIFYTLTSTEYWARAGSLVTTSLDASRDIALAPNTYVYYITGTPHAGSPFPPVKSGTRLWGNFASQWPVMRALLLAMQDWLGEGKEPPPSRYPRIADGQLVPVERAGFPSIPGMPFPEGVPKIYRMDFGPRFLVDGLVSHQPPKLGEPLPLLVPSVDADGNERAGIQLPHLAVPLGTYTGWNYQDPPPGKLQPLAGLIGSYFPFSRTRAERQLKNDPRISIEERYAGRDEYLARLAAAARELVSQRYLMGRDVAWIGDAGARQWDYTTSSGSPDRGQ